MQAEGTIRTNDGGEKDPGGHMGDGAGIQGKEVAEWGVSSRCAEMNTEMTLDPYELRITISTRIRLRLKYYLLTRTLLLEVKMPASGGPRSPAKVS